MLKAIRRAPNGKTEGADRLFAEALKVLPGQAAALLMAIWKKCGELSCFPFALERVLIVQAYKKGPRNIPSKYKPIALLSHIRKIIEKTLDTRVRAHYRFSPLQCGFRLTR